MEKRNPDLLQRIDMSKVSPMLITNGSIEPNNEWKKVLEESERLFRISIDGIGTSAEWNRYGTSWNKVLTNIPLPKKLITDSPEVLTIYIQLFQHECFGYR